ncbi:WD repeat-containing protein 18 [Latimeria chalumnae]|uniref:WD repeat-containing protein 18 n=1 Tax=Latimeria chalumnae TaxID=7897 RepID=H3B7I8_LATCH|nr:PREDICTED: WD repeat-containing protein 18 [Latimeria chalumnae]XP_014344045.1 PREDICTED: WD repeat-containing protein 18 [Latimeria chalumnae]|eukprot:XP_014344044.1 PREDICTED: WD repeat-containing protein 18 [Latimeria chalumnae]
MAAPTEVIVSTDASGQLWNCSVSDLYAGANMLSYRGGNTSARALAVLNGEYLLGAQLGKNYINVWELQRKDQLQQKIVCPGMVTCLTTSPNGLYILAGIAEGIYLWEVCSGNLLAVLNRHYQDLTCLCFTDDSSHFISGGKDNLALVWNLCSVFQVELSKMPEPRHIWSRHTLPVTDIYCGFGGPLARVVTASLDQTIKLWEISSGELLMSVVFDVGIMSVTLDPSENHIFCGGSDGSIFQVNLFTWPIQKEKTFQTDKESSQTFKGHGNQVTCLSVSMDGSMLLSGSHDETVKLWDIQSKQCLRTVAHKGPVTNAFIMHAPANMFNSECKPSVSLPKFNKHMHTADSGEDREGDGIMLRLNRHLQGYDESYLEKMEKLCSIMCSATDKNVFGDGENTKVRIAELEDEVKTLKKINKDLYDFSTQILTKQA